MTNILNAFSSWVDSCKIFGVLYPVLLTKPPMGQETKFYDTTVGKVVVAVLIQVITATAAATLSSFVVLNILEYRVTRLEADIDRVEKSAKEKIDNHWRYFHDKERLSR